MFNLFKISSFRIIANKKRQKRSNFAIFNPLKLFQSSRVLEKLLNKVWDGDENN
jgi:hypothetical protein